MCELGDRLRAAREALGKDVGEFSRALGIKRAYLEALEACRFEELPEPILAKGYLRRYAQALGLDPEELVALYPAQAAPEPFPPASRRRRGWGVVLALVLFVGGAGGVLWWWQASRATPAGEPQVIVVEPLPEPEPVRLRVRTQPADAKVYLDGFALGAAPIELEVEPGQRVLRVEAEGFRPFEEKVDLSEDRELVVNLEPLPKPETVVEATPVAAQEVVLRFEGRSWVRVTTPEGERLFEGILEEGDELKYPLPVVVRVGNAGAVRAVVAGEDQGLMGRRGEVVERTFARPNP